MSNYTVSEVKSAIEADFDGCVNEFYGEIGSVGYFLSELGEQATYVNREGGGEGGGEYMDVVFKVGSQLFRKTGYYSSWDGSDWEEGDLEEVESFEKTVTDYRRI